MFPAFDQLEPAPVTVTVPRPPARLPMAPKLSANAPPPWIVSTPVPPRPTTRFRANASGVVISVELGVTVSMFASIVCLGKPPIQFPLRNQFEENCPVQSEVCARVGTVDAARSAIVARAVDEPNCPLRPGNSVRRVDAAPALGSTCPQFIPAPFCV